MKKETDVAFENQHLLTRDGVAKLLPVTADISRPQSGEAPDAWEGGARQDEWSLTAYFQQSARDGKKIQPINNCFATSKHAD